MRRFKSIIPKQNTGNKWADAFPRKAKKVHGPNAYDYSRVKYKNSRTKVEIGCNRCGGRFWQKPSSHVQGNGCPVCSGRLPFSEFVSRSNDVHGFGSFIYYEEHYKGASFPAIIRCGSCDFVFETTPSNHMNGTGCARCAGKLRLTSDEFAKRGAATHGDGAYGYQFVEYEKNNTKVLIVCNTCGDNFWQEPQHHMNGSGCPECAKAEAGKAKRLGYREFVSRSDEIHGGAYDYSLVDYQSFDVKVEIICRKCGKHFFQRPGSHLQGKGCEDCSYVERGAAARYDTREFIRLAAGVHGDKYDYRFCEYVSSQEPVKIVCNTCGTVFKQKPAGHLFGHGCHGCGASRSKGEERIAKFLTENLIKFQQEKTFPDLRRIGKLRFDFWLPEYNAAIEFNGIQHYEQDAFHFKDSTIEGDKIKADWCRKNRVRLITIRYDEDVESVLTSEVLGANHTDFAGT